MMRLKNKVIIVTGSCTGIGKAIAVRCAAEGACVVINGLEKEWGEQVVNDIGRERAVLAIEDITQPATPKKLLDAALSRFGRLDAIVNNAAWVVCSDVYTTDASLFRKVLDVNTVAPFMLIREALPHLSDNRGSVLNIGSVNAYSGEPDLMAYSVSKGALMTMTRNLGDALYRKAGIRVNQINPGWVLTENETTRKSAQGMPENWYTQLPDVYAPSCRIIHPEEIAAAAIYLLSDESGPISGQVLDIEQYPANGRNLSKN